MIGCAPATVPPAPEPASDVSNASTVCVDPRPQVCTMIFAPVCATHDDGRRETHASACNACADDTVVDHTNESCDEGSAL